MRNVKNYTGFQIFKAFLMEKWFINISLNLWVFKNKWVSFYNKPYYAEVRGAINYYYKRGVWGGSKSDSVGRAVAGGEKDD